MTMFNGLREVSRVVEEQFWGIESNTSTEQDENE